MRRRPGPTLSVSSAGAFSTQRRSTALPQNSGRGKVQRPRWCPAQASSIPGSPQLCRYQSHGMQTVACSPGPGSYRSSFRCIQMGLTHGRGTILRPPSDSEDISAASHARRHGPGRTRCGNRCPGSLTPFPEHRVRGGYRVPPTGTSGTALFGRHERLAPPIRAAPAVSCDYRPNCG